MQSFITSSRSHFFILSIVLFNLSACSHKPVHTQVNHIVLLWLKADVTNVKTEEIIRRTRELSNIEGVQQLQIGRSIASDRQIVDDSFDIGIYMRFNSKQAMQRYLQNPQHIVLVNKYIKPNIVKIVVYDF